VTASTVWVAPSATAYSCLCEECLDAASESGVSFDIALRVASVRGTLPDASALARAQCATGHELVIRRIEWPDGLSRRDPNQLELV